jgi:cytochrome c-type biogenesis protein CcmH/NrfG
MAVSVVLLLAFGTVGAIVFGGGSGGDDDATDLEVRVTPGAEIARLETQVAEHPDDVDAMTVLADVLANSGRVAESIHWFEAAIAKQPDDAELRMAFGRALTRQGSVFDAELQFMRAAELDPINPRPALYLAQLYAAFPESRLEEARAWYQKAIDLDPESRVAEQAREELEELNAKSGSPVASPNP